VFAVLASIILAFYGRDKLYFWGIVSVIIFITFSVSIILSIVFLLVGRKKKSLKFITLAKFSGFSILISFILFSSVIIAGSIAQHDTKQAKNFCDSAIAKIEQYKSKNNQYPSSIHKIIPNETKLPLRIREYSFYQTDGKRYRFIVPIISPNTSAYVYESNEKTWKLIDFIFDLEEL
jgi:hypothetical protein